MTFGLLMILMLDVEFNHILLFCWLCTVSII